MPKNTKYKKIMVIGSGPIVIGQAAEFDYAGTQACRALKEEGVKVVLVNSNPATIMTDREMADRVYIEPISIDILEEIIIKEKPDALLSNLGGQVGLNMSLTLAKKGILEREGVTLLGSPMEAIEKAEDREMFKETMRSINEPVPESTVVSSIEDALEFAARIGYPLIVRPGYTLGGTGGGFATNDIELREIAKKGLTYSMNKQLLIERSVKGWKEIEFEVIRDSRDNCITVCSMENMDPMGIHTGDSIVVAPAQTLTDPDLLMLKNSAFRIIRALGITGGCNIQYALNPTSNTYYIIEVNPRVSRSSALASKATGYPIAKVAVKIALGYTLDEIANTVTGTTSACFEPTIDYVVVKIPRWPFDKFRNADRELGSQMKATGEVMALGATFKQALLKAIRSLEAGFTGMFLPSIEKYSLDELMRRVVSGSDERMFELAECLRRGISIEQLHNMTGVDPFFLDNIKRIVCFEEELRNKKVWCETDFMKAKKYGFSDFQISYMLGCSESEARERRKDLGIEAKYNIVDTCAGEFEAVTPYYYSLYGVESELKQNDNKKVVVLGSGPIRIGQGIEFDYCSVHASLTLKSQGVESIVINSNPETVSTDPDTSDRLYFEPLTVENVLDVIEAEDPMGVVVQFGGQTAINLAKPLKDKNIKILGTSVKDIDAAEDRERFDDLLEELNIPRPPGNLASNKAEARGIASRLGFPVLVRPSYVLGGRAMEIIYNEEDLETYLEEAVKVSSEHPVLVDRYYVGKEVEVDAICDGSAVLIPGIMEHLERAGVHSGDSIAIYPPQTLEKKHIDTLIEYTRKLALALKIKGLVNIQYVIHDDEVYCIEVNPRASRTVPYLSKITRIPMVQLATRIMLGETLKSMGYSEGYMDPKNLVAIKMPVFSFNKLTGVEPSLGPEMKSTGEVMGIDSNFATALHKAFIGAGYNVPKAGEVLATICDKDKEESLELMKTIEELGFKIWATAGTADYLEKNGVAINRVEKIGSGGLTVVDLIRNGNIAFVVNTFTRGKQPLRDGFQIRRTAVEFNIPCMTSLDTCKGLLEVIKNKREDKLTVKALQDY